LFLSVNKTPDFRPENAQKQGKLASFGAKIAQNCQYVCLARPPALPTHQGMKLRPALPPLTR